MFQYIFTYVDYIILVHNYKYFKYAVLYPSPCPYTYVGQLYNVQMVLFLHSSLHYVLLSYHYRVLVGLKTIVRFSFPVLVPLELLII